ncbi:LapA family protein [Luteimonas vadosa]|uniref:Lipopolysaccharide assembly protein A domain-containing protein n=1 Tax=Luteimonas vadosa TaxID=1165507 RepID=A0ABP9E8B4_9GAMM
MRVLRLLLAFASIALGVAIGALNPQAVTLDLGVVLVPTTLGVLVLSTLLLGAILGGIMLVASVVLPLRRRLHQARTGAGRASDRD